MVERGPLTFERERRRAVETHPHVREVLLLNQSAATQEILGVALAQSIDAMYGPPEYGGNRGLVGWTTTGSPQTSACWK